MSLAATISADLRARSTWMPYCPNCSLQVGSKAQQLTGPHLRTVAFPPSRDWPDGREIVKVIGCCAYSTPEDNYFEDQASAAAWWRSARLLEVGDVATESRRRRTLQRLATAGLEPIQ